MLDRVPAIVRLIASDAAELQHPRAVVDGVEKAR
jgi:hypothetical protein